YLKLQVRYTTIGWIRQSTIATKNAIRLQPESEQLSEDAKKKAGALFDVIEKLLLFGEIADDLEKGFKSIYDLSLGEADKKLDQYEHVKQAKDGLKNVFTLVSQTVQETIDGSLEHLLFPALGLPLEYIPEGKSAEEYLKLALKYEMIGACEPCRLCL